MPVETVFLAVAVPVQVHHRAVLPVLVEMVSPAAVVVETLVVHTQEELVVLDLAVLAVHRALHFTAEVAEVASLAQVQAHLLLHTVVTVAPAVVAAVVAMVKVETVALVQCSYSTKE
jgi:hypothetical protein